MAEIVPMTGAQLDAAAALERACFSVPWSRDALAEELQAPFSVFFAALEAGADGQKTFAGYLGAQLVADEVSVLKLAVAPAFRRRGVGSALLGALLARVPAGARVFLEVRESNGAARALYRAFGFAEVGRRRGYYRDPDEDALILARCAP